MKLIVGEDPDTIKIIFRTRKNRLTNNRIRDVDLDTLFLPKETYND
jgi:hypothetical protein